jgi:tetratricopeptide (TPR) repeat protein
VSIPACTSIIEAGTQPPRALAAAHNNRGISYRRRDELYAALADYNSAITLDPASAKARYNRAIVLNELKMTERALADLDQALALEPQYAKAYALRGTAQFETDREAALSDIEQALHLAPKLQLDRAADIASVLRQEADQHLSDNATEDAVKLLELARQINPSDTSAAFKLGQVFEDGGNFERAVKVYDDEIERDPELGEAYLHRCLAQAQRGKLDTALKDCDQGSEHYTKGDGFASEARAYILLRKGKYQDVVAALTEAIAGSPNAIAPYAYRAQALAKQGKRAAALADYDKARTLQARHGRDVKALEDARRAVGR